MKMNNKQIILIMILIVLISSLSTIIAYYQLIVYDIVNLQLEVEVVDKGLIGFNTDQDAIRFGKVAPGGLAKRYIVVDNNESETFKIDMKTYGNITSWILVSENGFILEQNETKEITVSCNVPPDAEKGLYTGTLQIIYLRKLI